ncbi:MAG: hypothetical protein RQ966_06185 [Acetobacteraceae bacterium]|nr:hypothetical protein [Acetobacteraceae bacterium]
MFLRAATVLMSVSIGTASAQVPPDIAARAAHRFPQPVRVESLIGRDVLEPVEAQPVLGHVEAVTRRPDGGTDLILRLGGVLGVGGRPIAVPSEAVGLLGEYVAVLDYTPQQLESFPTVSPTDVLPGSAIVRIGLTKPFH